MRHSVKRVPQATYRIQFHGEYTFKDALEIIDYLEELGITDIYASPLFHAGPGSTHGYDVCSYEKINPNLGSPEEFEEFARELRKRQLGLLVDMVPNHMAAHLSNPWWRDVLARGEQSKYGHVFDIDWQSPDPSLRGKVMLPILGDRYHKVLEGGELKLNHGEEGFELGYYENRLPLSPETQQKLREESKGYESVEAFLEEINSTGSRERLDKIIQEQNYRLAYWRIAPQEINYRRFFDITGLVSVRVEDPEVFKSTHCYLSELANKGIVTGVRVDHPDGLWDPAGYFRDLQQILGVSDNGQEFYILAEKILSAGEQLPEEWPIAGTTGYDYLNFLNGLFVEQQNEQALEAIYKSFAGTAPSFEEMVYTAKGMILERAFAAEMRRLSRLVKELAASTIRGRDFTQAELEVALRAYICAFPVYRSYISNSKPELSARELEQVKAAFRVAQERENRVEEGLWSFLFDLIVRPETLNGQAAFKTKWLYWIGKVQQLTSPLMAKGLEDTTFYRYNRLVSLNEVGGHPGHFGTSLAEFHAHNQAKQQGWPEAMLATATHDTKRGEDMRARLNVLSELPKEWEKMVQKWKEINRVHVRQLPAGPAPSANDEYFFYQTVAGSWTLDCGTASGLAAFQKRISEYMLKAIREAKVHTSWTDQNEEYESAVKEFVQATLSPESSYVQALDPFVSKLSRYGYWNSLSQVAIKLTSPGVPDTYQGTEFWDFSLVDPDNRRPVDYALRRQSLKKLIQEEETSGRNSVLDRVKKSLETGEIKQFLIWSILQYRRQHPELFTRGSYLPLEVHGPLSEHVIAYARTTEDALMIVLCCRFLASLNVEDKGSWKHPGWDDTYVALPLKGPVQLQDLLTGNKPAVEEAGGERRLKMKPLMTSLPLCVLRSIS